MSALKETSVGRFSGTAPRTGGWLAGTVTAKFAVAVPVAHLLS